MARTAIEICLQRISITIQILNPESSGHKLCDLSQSVQIDTTHFSLNRCNKMLGVV